MAVRSGCGVNVAVAFVLAGGAGVSRVLEVTVCPTVRSDGAVGRVTRCGLAASGRVGRDDGGCVSGAVIAGRSGSGGETAVLICGMEVGLEDGHGLVAVREATPFSTSDVEQAGGIHDVVALADDGRH